MKNLKNLFDLIPFLNLYPVWAQIMIFACAIIILSILIFVPRKTPQPEESKISVSVEHKQPPKAVLDINISPDKILTLKNNGNISLENVQVFATKYLLDEQAFNENRIEIKNFNKIGGSIHTVSILKISIEENIDLTKKPFLKFFDNPGKNDNTPILTYFCLRITYDASSTKEKYTFYKVTSSIKNFPLWVDNQERTAYAGETSHDFLFDIPDIIEKHQKKIYNDK